MNFNSLGNGGFEASAANAVVNCGNHTAARCENCKGGRKGCFEEGDCRWNYLTYTCVNKGRYKSYQTSFYSIEKIYIPEFYMIFIVITLYDTFLPY